MQRTTPHTPLSSKDNSLIRYLRSLTDAKYRKKEQSFLIDGIKMIEEALRDDAGVTMVVAAPTVLQHHGKGVLKLAEAKGIDIIWISERLMDWLSESKTPQPVVAVVEMKKHASETLFAREPRLIVLAHRLQDPGNLGTIIRTAEAVGAAGVAITSNTVDPYNAKAVRASMGSILRLPVVPVGDPSDFIQKCKQMRYQTIATVLTGEKTPYDINLTIPSLVILGQEGLGLQQDIMDSIDFHVRIPMTAAIDSLNVATAAAVILYEAVRQRLRK